MSKRPVSVLVVVHSAAFDILMLRRVAQGGFWQSVTGSLEAGETPAHAAQREVLEETGLDCPPEAFTDLRLRNRFVIPAPWRDRYGPGVSHNWEHAFGLRLATRTAIRLAPGEHCEGCWVDSAQALQMAWSWTNRDAIRLLASDRC